MNLDRINGGGVGFFEGVEWISKVDRGRLGGFCLITETHLGDFLDVAHWWLLGIRPEVYFFYFMVTFRKSPWAKKIKPYKHLLGSRREGDHLIPQAISYKSLWRKIVWNPMATSRKLLWEYSCWKRSSSWRLPRSRYVVLASSTLS